MSKRDAYVERIKNKLDEWNADLDRLQARADRAEADVKRRYQEQIVELKSRRDAVKSKLDLVMNAGEDAWEDLKEGVENAMESLKQMRAPANV